MTEFESREIPDRRRFTGAVSRERAVRDDGSTGGVVGIARVEGPQVSPTGDLRVVADESAAVDVDLPKLGEDTSSPIPGDVLSEHAVADGAGREVA